MNNTKLTKYATIIISVLSASLLNEYIVNYINSYYKERSYLSVLIGMLVTVAVFVPVYGVISKWMNTASKKYLKASKKVAKKDSTGIIVGFLIAFSILFILFAKIRHHIDVLAELDNLL